MALVAANLAIQPLGRAAPKQVDPLSVAVSYDEESAAIGCETGDDELVEDSRTNLVTSEDPPSDHEELIEGCVTDQAGTLADEAQITFELEGPAGFTGRDCEPQSLDDPNDGVEEVCTSNYAGPDGVYDTDFQAIEDANGDLIRGEVTVTFCVDAEGSDSDSAELGCADEEVVSILTGTFAGNAAGVSLVFETEGAGSSEDPCAEGDRFRTMGFDDQEKLIVCTYDDRGTLVSTDAAHLDGMDNGALGWQNTGPAVASLYPEPPTETGADGTAEAALVAHDYGGTTVTVTLDPQMGPDQSSSVTASMEGCRRVGTRSRRCTPEAQCNDAIDNDSDGFTDFPDDPGCTALYDNSENTARMIKHPRTSKITMFKHVKWKGRRFLLVEGWVSSPNYADCEAFVPVEIQLKIDGAFAHQKRTLTNKNGHFEARIEDQPGHYKLKASKYVFGDARFNEHICKRDSGEKRHSH